MDPVAAPGRTSVRVQLMIAGLAVLLALAGIGLAAGQRPDHIDLSVGHGDTRDLTLQDPTTTTTAPGPAATTTAPSTTTAAPATTAPTPTTPATTASPTTTTLPTPQGVLRVRLYSQSMQGQGGWCVQAITAAPHGSLQLEGQAYTDGSGRAVLEALPVGPALAVVSRDCLWQLQLDQTLVRTVQLAEGWPDEVLFVIGGPVGQP